MCPLPEGHKGPHRCRDVFCGAAWGRALFRWNPPTDVLDRRTFLESLEEVDLE